MRTIKLKTTSGSCGRLSLQHPSAPVGMSGDGSVATYAVTDVPDTASAAEAVILADQTAFVGGAYQARFAELGAGAIIRR